MRAPSLERLGCALAAALAAGTVLRFGVAGPRLAELPVVPTAPPAEAVEVGEAEPALDESAPGWRASETAGGSGVRFELFTPPVVWYDAAAARLVLLAAGEDPSQEPASEPFGLELLALARPPFRVQLVGYVADAESCRGVFANLQTRETFLARAGQAVPELGVRIDKVSLARLGDDPALGAAGKRVVVTAEVEDLASGERILLSNRTRQAGGAWRARVRLIETGEIREESIGTEIVGAHAAYRLVRLREEPLALEVVRRGPDGLEEVRWLAVVHPPESLSLARGP